MLERNETSELIAGRFRKDAVGNGEKANERRFIKNHISVQRIPRSQLSELSGQLLQSGLGEPYFVYHPNSESLALHSSRPITFRLRFRLTNIVWTPFKGKQQDFSFVQNAKEGGIEKILLNKAKEELETRKSTAAAADDFKQNAKEGGSEKILLNDAKEELETRKSPAAAAADFKHTELFSRIEHLAEWLAEVHADIESLRAQVRDAHTAKEVKSREVNPRSKGNSDMSQRNSIQPISEQHDPAKYMGNTDKLASKTSEDWAEDYDESACGDNGAAGGGASIPDSLRAPQLWLATANKIPMKVASEYNADAVAARMGTSAVSSSAVPVRVVEHPAAVPAPPVPPAGYRVACAAEVQTGKALVGKWLLYHWPTIGWVRGWVHAVRRSRKGYSHLVKYGPTSAMGAAVVSSLLDARSHGPEGRWVLLLLTG
jgi:hypothetical protein